MNTLNLNDTKLPNTNTNNTNVKKTIKSNQDQNLEWWKLHNRSSVHFNTTENYEGWFIFISILELPPNTNKDDTRVWKIMPIWIRIVLGLEKSSKYEYE